MEPSLRRRRWPRRTREALATTLIALASTALALAVAEVGARWWLPEVSDTLAVQLTWASEKYHHTPRFSLDPVDEDAVRIVFLGDSFTYGLCPREFTYPHLVERDFRDGSVAGIPPRRVQAFNLGTPSYSPSIYGVLLRDYVPVLRPQLVVIAVDDSDPQDDFWYRKAIVRDADGLPVSVYPALPGVPHWLVPLARRLKILRVTLGVLRQRGFAPQTITFDAEDARFAPPSERLVHYDPARAPAWAPRFAYTLDLVDAMVRYCRRHDVPVAIVNYPYAPAVTTEHWVEGRKQFGLDATRVYDPLFHALEADYAHAHGVPYYDFTPYLRALPSVDGIYNEGDGHFSSHGNELFAAELVRFLAPLVDQDHRALADVPRARYTGRQ